MKFTFNGRETPIVNLLYQRIIAVASRLEDGTLVDSAEMARLTGYAVNTLRCGVILGALPEHRFKFKGKSWYGNRKTVAEWKSKHENQNERAG